MRLQRLRKILTRIAIAGAALCAAFVVAAVIFAFHCASVDRTPKIQSEASRRRAPVTAGIADYRRDEDSTYLGYPEWFIVWSYTEKADFQERNLPSGFPFFRSIQQYWSGYCCVHGMTRGKYPFNFGEHLMLVVIGTSFSVEYAIRGVYEGTIGRLTEWISGHDASDEDVFSARVAREYADFVHVRPFYEFSFWTRFKRLWSEVPLRGGHPVRKLERRLLLSVDYSLEAFYCWIIEAGTHLVYGIEPDTTYAWIEHASDTLFAENKRIRKVKDAGAGSYIVVVPRYQEFTTIAAWLAARDVRFAEVAGNDEILVTALAPRDWRYDLSVGEEAFATSLATAPERKRLAIATPVASLHTVMNGLKARGIPVEHVYDY